MLDSILQDIQHVSPDLTLTRYFKTVPHFTISMYRMEIVRVTAIVVLVVIVIGVVVSWILP